MKTLVLAVLFFVAGVAFAQTCIVPAPSAPPVPSYLVVNLPPDGGSSGCTAYAVVSGGANPRTYPVSNAKCAVVVAMALQAAANDNGWNDGGVP
jgi:hypothetical protein